ncbi:MAG: hypothetical protein WB869_00580 [Candidatus Acidiferrales bacterium]
MVKAGEVLADGNLNTVFCDPHGVTGRWSKLELFPGSFVRGAGVAMATLEEVSGVSVAVNAGAVLDSVFAGDVAGLAPFPESDLIARRSRRRQTRAFARMASGEF